MSAGQYGEMWNALEGDRRPQEKPTWLTTKQAAVYLTVSEQTVRKYVHSGGLRASRVGVIIRIRREDIDKFLADSPCVGGPVACRGGKRRGRKPGPKPQNK